MLYSFEREFAGYFIGEGYLGIQKYTRKYKPKKENSIKRSSVLYRPQMTICARMDEVKTLEFIKERLGGYLIRNLHSSNSKSKPYALWGTNSTEVIKRVCDILIKSKIPSGKIKQAKIMKKYLNMRLENGTKIKYSGRRYSEKDIEFMEWCKQELQRLKKYSL